MTIHLHHASAARLMLSDAIDGLRVSREALAHALMQDLHRRYTQPQVDHILGEMRRLNIEHQMQDSPRPDPGLLEPETAPRPDFAVLHHALTVTDAQANAGYDDKWVWPQGRAQDGAAWGRVALWLLAGAALAVVAWFAVQAQLTGLAAYDGVFRHG